MIIKLIINLQQLRNMRLLNKFNLLFLIFFGMLIANKHAYSKSQSYMNFYDHEDNYNYNEIYYDENLSQELSDPFETPNRIIFSFNMTIDTILIEPLVGIYRFAIPNPAQKHLGYFIKNLSSPITLTNDLLQGQPVKARTTFWRFIVNTLFGFGGIADVASEMKLEYHSEDLAQTIKYWGMPSGPYIMLPLLGPTTTTGIIGKVGDYFVDPMNLNFNNKVKNKIKFLKFLDLRSSKYDLIKNIKSNSLDPYTTIKVLYYQNKQEEVVK